MKKITLSFILLLYVQPVLAQSMDDPFKFEGLFYLTYLNGEVGGQDKNQFSIDRSYFTLRTQVLPNLQSRITMDATQDREGDGRGDMKVRLKYAYAKYDFGDVGGISGLGLEGGIVHMVWLDFEEHINLYRFRDKMFMERSGLFNSADFGLTLTGGFGESLPDDYRQNVTSSYAQRYGSFAVGVYNGGGYHGDERNTNKVFQGRLTLRPLPDVAPGFQVSGLAIVGEGNQAGEADEIPNWRTYNIFASYQAPKVVLTGQYVWGEGNQKGSWTDPFDDTVADTQSGFSFFGEGKLPDGWRVIAGFDRFERTPGNTDLSFDRFHAGIGRDLGGKNILMLDWDRREFDDATLAVDTRYRLIMQLKY